MLLSISLTFLRMLKLCKEILFSLVGASWGSDMRKKNARTKWKKSWAKILKDDLAWAARSRKGPDQQVLAKYVINIVDEMIEVIY